MKTPKTFIQKDLKKIKSYDSEKNIQDTSQLIADEFILDCNEKSIRELDLYNNFLSGRGVDTETLEKILLVWYDNSIRVILFQYKTKASLTKSLRNAFEEGMMYHSERELKFTEKFLFKDKIAIHLDGKKTSIEKLVSYYRNLGFKQLDYKLKII